ncbi:hypothetical protein QJQ45_012664 [Haematococcus lacustris]|nr:hypothetical protein QJQ45_012664 [Haematococcus lacustris]
MAARNAALPTKEENREGGELENEEDDRDTTIELQDALRAREDTQIVAVRAAVIPITPSRLGGAGGAGGSATPRSYVVAPAAPPPVPVVWCFQCGVTDHKAPDCPDGHLTQEDAMRKNDNLAPSLLLTMDAQPPDPASPAMALVAAVAVVTVVVVVAVAAGQLLLVTIGTVRGLVVSHSTLEAPDDGHGRRSRRRHNVGTGSGGATSATGAAKTAGSDGDDSCPDGNDLRNMTANKEPPPGGDKRAERPAPGGQTPGSPPPATPSTAAGVPAGAPVAAWAPNTGTAPAANNTPSLSAAAPVFADVEKITGLQPAQALDLLRSVLTSLNSIVSAQPQAAPVPPATAAGVGPLSYAGALTAAPILPEVGTSAAAAAADEIQRLRQQLVGVTAHLEAAQNEAVRVRAELSEMESLQDRQNVVVSGEQGVAAIRSQSDRPVVNRNSGTSAALPAPGAAPALSGTVAPVAPLSGRQTPLSQVAPPANATLAAPVPMSKVKIPGPDKWTDQCLATSRVAEIFCEDLEVHCAYLRIDPADALPNFLTGKAREVWYTATRNAHILAHGSRPTWAHLRTSFKEMAGDDLRNESDVHRRKLLDPNALRMSAGSTLNAYITDFRNTLTVAGSTCMAPAMLVATFIRGLTSELQSSVVHDLALMRDPTLNDAIQAAVNAQKVLFAVATNHVGRRPPAPHVAAFVPPKQMNRLRTPPGLAGGPPPPAHRGPYWDVSSSSSSGGHRGSRHSSQGGGRHAGRAAQAPPATAPVCPAPAAGGSTLPIPGYACHHCWNPNHFRDYCNLKHLPADEARRVQSLNCKVDLLVMPEMFSAFDVLMGSDWLQSNGALLDYLARTVTLQMSANKTVLKCEPAAPILAPHCAHILAKHSHATVSAKVAYKWLRKGGQSLVALISSQPVNLTAPPANLLSVHPTPSPANLLSNDPVPHTQSTTSPPDTPINYPTNIPHAVAAQLTTLISEFEDVFAPFNKLPPQRSVGHTIPLQPGCKPPALPSYKMSQPELLEMKKQVAAFLEQGIIEPSSSPYAAPVLFVKKKSGELRMCVDYRQLNKITLRDQYPLPRVDDLFDRLAGCTVFSSLDLQAGYHQIRIPDEDVPKTAFRTPTGLYQFKVLCFGLTNAPATFQRVMNNAFADVINDCALVYIDDILIMSKSVPDHFNHLRRVLELLRKHQFQAKLSKCEFLKTALKFLGHIVSDQGIAVDPDKVKSITSWPVPRSLTAMQQFLGAANFVRKFVHNFSALAAPLTDLTGKVGIEFNWHKWPDDKLQAFDALKHAISKVPLLKIPDITKPFQVYCDASLQGVGAVLMQEGYPLAYLSKKLIPAEKNYTTGEQELLAIITACKEWRCYLEGVPFTLYTDHKPLVALKTQKVLSRRQTRWLEFLSRYNFTIEYLPGDTNPADPLSRIPDAPVTNPVMMMTRSRKRLLEGEEATVQQQQPVVQQPQQEPQPHLVLEQPLPPPPVPLHPLHAVNMTEQLLAAYAADEAFASMVDQYDQDQHGLYRTRGRNQIVVPNCPELKTRILVEMHDAQFAGHVGITKTLERISRMFWWPRMRSESDGQTERYNRTLEEMLRHYISPAQSDWPFFLSLAEFAVNNSWQESIQSTPFLVNTGQSPLTPALLELPGEVYCPTARRLSEWWQSNVKQARHFMELAQRRQAYMANKGRQEVEYHTGQLVLLSTKNLRMKPGKAKKLLPRFIGPFKVLEHVGPVAVRLDLPRAMARMHPVFHVSLLRPYTSEHPHLPPPVEWLDEAPLYEVEKLLAHRGVRAGQPKRGKRRSGPRTLTCPPPFTLTPMARVGLHFIKLDSWVLHGPHLQHLAAASSAGTSLEANLRHITVTLATWDAVWEVYLDRKWAQQRLRLHGAQDWALEQFFKKLEKDMAEVSMERHGRAKQLVVFFGAASIGNEGGWGAAAVLRACCKVVRRPRGSDQLRGRVVLVDEHRTSRVSSAVNGQQPCEEELDHEQPTRPADLTPRKPTQAPCSIQEAIQPAASEPGPSTPPPAKRGKRTKAEPEAAEPTQPTKAAKAKPAPQPGRWLDRDCNAALNMQRIGEIRPGYKRLRDKPPKAQQQQQQQQQQPVAQ